MPCGSCTIVAPGSASLLSNGISLSHPETRMASLVPVCYSIRAGDVEFRGARGGRRLRFRPGCTGAYSRARFGEGEANSAILSTRASTQQSVPVAPNVPAAAAVDSKLGPLDDFFLKVFRNNLVKEVGWESQKPGYDGLLEVVRHCYTNSSKPDVERLTVRVFTALFPGFVLLSFRKIILPIANGKAGAMLMAFATQVATKWLMGPSAVNKITLEDGSSLSSGVLVQKCKFLEGSQCAGICMHMCKIPTQEFFKDVMGVPVSIEPNFTDFSCQFKIGVHALPRDVDPVLQTPCLSICPTAMARSNLRSYTNDGQCPQTTMRPIAPRQNQQSQSQAASPQTTPTPAATHEEGDDGNAQAAATALVGGRRWGRPPGSRDRAPCARQV